MVCFTKLEFLEARREVVVSHSSAHDIDQQLSSEVGVVIRKQQRVFPQFRGLATFMKAIF